MDVREVALALVALVNRGEGGVLEIPAYVRWVAWFGVLPVGVRKWVRGWSGIDGAVGEGREGDK